MKARKFSKRDRFPKLRRWFP